MWWRVAAVVLAGIALAFSFPLSLPAVDAFPEYGVWHFFLGSHDISSGFIQFQGLACVALLPFFAAIRGLRRPAHGFWLGYICGLAWLIPGLIWLGSFGVVPVLLVPFYFALPLGLFGYLCWWLLNTPWAAASPARFVWGVPVVWTAIEYLRSFGFWAFPWNLLGYSLAREPLFIQAADLGGVYSVSFAILLCNSALAVLLLRPPAEMLERLRPLKAWRWPARLAQAVLATGLLCLLLGYGLWRLDWMELPQLWDSALAAQDGAGPDAVADKNAAGVQRGQEAGREQKLELKQELDKLRQQAEKSGKSGTQGAGKRDTGKNSAKGKGQPPVRVKIEVDKPLDVILVQGGLNTRERWRSAGLLERTLAAYVDPSETAIDAWRAEHQLGGGQSSSLVFRNSLDPRAGEGRSPALPVLDDSAAPAGTVARGDELAPGQDASTRTPAFSRQPPLPDERTPAASAGSPAGRPATAAKGDDPDLLLVWPESVLPLYLDPSRSQNLPRECRQLLRKAPNTALLLGAIGEPRQPEQYENGAMFFTRDGAAIWPHSKVRVVPFGEVVPFRRAISFLDYPWGSADVTEGRFIEPLVWKSHRLGLMICFDNVFGFLSRREALAGADSFVLMTNNSWYKLASGVRQHADIDILRAVETRRPLARVSTTGESHLIDSAGRVVQKTGPQSAAVISGRLERGTEKTLYYRVGDLFAQLCLLCALLLCVPPILLRRGEGLL